MKRRSKVTRTFFSPQDIADRMGCHPATVRRWIQSGKLRAFQPGGEYRIRESDFEEFLRDFEVHPKDLPGPRPPKSAEELLAEGATYPRDREDSAFIIVGRIIRDSQGENYKMCVLWNVPPEERERLRPRVRRLAGDDFIERDLHSEAGQRLLAAAAG
jgi:excisionase family DNA binding protein